MTIAKSHPLSYFGCESCSKYTRTTSVLRQLNKIILKDPMYWKSKLYKANSKSRGRVGYSTNIEAAKTKFQQFVEQSSNERSYQTFDQKQFIQAFEIMKQHVNDYDPSVDKMVLANGNEMFIKNIDKVRRTFYDHQEIVLPNKNIIIKGKKKSVHKKVNISMPLSNNTSPTVK